MFLSFLFSFFFWYLQHLSHLLKFYHRQKAGYADHMLLLYLLGFQMFSPEILCTWPPTVAMLEASLKYLENLKLYLVKRFHLIWTSNLSTVVTQATGTDISSALFVWNMRDLILKVTRHCKNVFHTLVTHPEIS